MVALPPRRALCAVPSSAMRHWSIASCSSARWPRRAGAISSLTARTAWLTPGPPKAVSWSRRSTPAWVPRDAPAGAMARPNAPPARRTSTSTVGRPRESHTRRPMTSEMCVSVILTCGFDIQFVRPGGRHLRQALARMQEQVGRYAAHALLVAFFGHVLDRRFAVDARQKQPGQQARGPLLHGGSGLPRDAGHIAAHEHRIGCEELRG